MKASPAVWPGPPAAATRRLGVEYSRRLAIAIEAERNQAEAQRRPPDIDGARRQVLAELGLVEGDIAAMFPSIINGAPR